MIDLQCPECDESMILRDSRFGLFYGCSTYPDCKGTHGAHPDGRPLGKPANAETKKARMAAHKTFDRLWTSGRMSRTKAYRWLKYSTRLPNHIGEMDKNQCEELMKKVRNEFAVPDRAGG